jgi:hypothetical protein
VGQQGHPTGQGAGSRRAGHRADNAKLAQGGMCVCGGGGDARTGGAPGQQRLASRRSGRRQLAKVRPGPLWVDIILGDRADAAPVVDPGTQQRHPPELAQSRVAAATAPPRRIVRFRRQIGWRLLSEGGAHVEPLPPICLARLGVFARRAFREAGRRLPPCAPWHSRGRSKSRAEPCLPRRRRSAAPNLYAHARAQ